jgi:multidrug efflux pump subunit AcrA (membrane-fusion protein)
MSELEQALQEAQERVATLEAQLAPRQTAEAEARILLGKLIKKRQRVQQRGVPMWEAAQRGALRMVVLAAGCIALITGSMALDGTLGTGAIVISMFLLVFEGMR